MADLKKTGVRLREVHLFTALAKATLLRNRKCAPEARQSIGFELLSTL